MSGSWALGLALAGVLSGHAAELWRIGRFDESSAEFSPIVDPATGARRIDYADPNQDPVYRVGRSDPARHWFAFQPGTANGATGARAHPFTIEFELAQPPPPADRVRLDLALLAYSTRLPRLDVTINGRTGSFFQQPGLAYSAGDPSVFYLPHYATSRISLAIPLAFLQTGLNRLVLTPVDEPGDRDDIRPSGYAWPGNSGVVYDAVALMEESGLPRPEDVGLEVRVDPTVFYRQIDGRLHERLDVVVRHRIHRPLQGLELEVGEWRGQLALRPETTSFGETRWEVWVPEFRAGTPAVLTLVGVGAAREKHELNLRPARRWEVRVVPNEHLDIGYTDHEWRVAELQVRNVEAAVELARQHADFHFTFDGFWILEQYLASRGPSARAELVTELREGRLRVPAVYGSGFTGFSSLENLIRGLYPSHRFATQYGLPLDCALITDVPSYSWSVASVLAAAGIGHFVAASDAYRAPFLLYNRFHATSPHRWEGPDGGRVTTWYSRHYHQVASLFGMPPQLAQGRESLPRFLMAYDHSGYKASTVILYGTQVENTALHPAQATFVEEWNRSFAYPRLRYSGFTEALQQIEAESGGELPVHRGDGGPYWEDGLGANARITALARQNMQRALSAEIWGAVASALDSKVETRPARLEAIWRQLLLTDEHTWHADQSVRDPESDQSRRQGAVRDLRTTRAAAWIDEHVGQSLASVGHSTVQGPGRIVLFNSLSWPRQGLIEVDVPLGRGVGQIHQVLGRGNGFERIRFLSPQMPAVGWAAVEIGVPSAAERGMSDREPVLENAWYRVEFDVPSGAIRSIRDKELGREWVDTAAGHRFGQHLYVTGGDALPNRLVQFSTVHPEPALTIHGATGGRFVSREHFSWGQVAVLESTNVLAPSIHTEVLLPSWEKRLDIAVRVRKEPTLAKEAAYVAFPFAADAPRFRYATQNGFVDPARDLLPGASCEWFAIQSWLALEEDGDCALWTPIDAPLVTIGDIARGRWPASFGTRPGRVFSYVMNNYTPEGYQAGQSGEFLFRFALTTRRGFDAVAAHRFGAGNLMPIERNETHRNDRIAPAKDGGPGAREASYLTLDTPNVSLVTWKQAESGDAMVLRFVEVAGQATRVGATLGVPGVVRAAWRCDALERKQEPLRAEGRRFEFATTPFGIHTIRLEWVPDLP